MVSAADALVSCLATEGVEAIFRVSGPTTLPIDDALSRQSMVRAVRAVHQQGAGHMAQGYARASGAVGVALASSGPGAASLVTPIADAWMDSTPLVCITGQVPRDLIGADGFQECDITGLTVPVVKHSWCVRDASELPMIVRDAFALARSGRCGPVLIDIPIDVQTTQISADEIGRVNPQVPDLTASDVDTEAVRAAAGAIFNSRAPILYVGGGTLNGDACQELLDLAELAGLPIVTTLMGKSAFPETHELHFGWPGMHGPKWSNLALNHADLIIAVGARFDDRVTGRVTDFAPGARVVHLDIDSYEIDKIRRADIPIAGPLKPALALLSGALRLLLASERWSCEGWRTKIDRWRTESPLRFDRDSSQLKPQRVVEILQQRASENTIFTTGVGQHQMWAMQYLRPIVPRTFITSGGLGTMGYGIPAAIGAKAARPDKNVICIDGDGCFQMTARELSTAVREDLPIIVVLVNNGYLGMVTQWQDMFFDRRRSHTTLSNEVPDYAKVAAAYGAVGVVAESNDEFIVAIDEALSLDRTVVIDCRTDPREQCFPMILPGGAAVDVVAYPEELAETSAKGQAAGAALTRDAL